MTGHETIATFPLADRARAAELRDRLLAEGRIVWLQLETEPDLTVSVTVQAALDNERAGQRLC